MIKKCVKEVNIITMYKTELIKRIAKDTRLSQRIVSDVLSTGLDEIRLALSKGEKAVLPGFGTFYTRRRAKSEARNFETGRVISVPEMNQAAFKVGEILKRSVRRGK